MLFRFKSKATGDLTMLGHDAQHVLRLWGKEETGPGVLLVEEMDAAAAALVAEADREEQAVIEAKAQAKENHEPEPQLPPVTWRARIQPMLKTLEYCKAEDAPLRWEN